MNVRNDSCAAAYGSDVSQIANQPSVRPVSDSSCFSKHTYNAIIAQPQCRDAAMPVTYNVDPESGIVHLDFFGQVSVPQRIAAYELMRDDPDVGGARPVLVLSDRRHMESVFTANDLKALVRQVREMRADSSNSVYVAALVSEPVQYGLGRMSEVFFEDVADVKVFYDYDDARNWLLEKRDDR